jgi:hypothetical protein
VTNPLGLPDAASLLKATTTVGGVLSLGLGLAGVLCLALRFRTSHGIERQQIKWLVFVALAAVLIVLIDIAAGRIAAGSDVHDAVDSIFWGLLVTTVLLGMPLAIGAAILRYRLFDIDRIISRTLSYALITGVYVGLVVLFQRATRSFTEGSDLAVAASTLLVAAAFVPVRRRVQNVVDRRFNRARYDAARTIETFSARLREEIDLEALGSELRDVVTRTMQPSRVQLWLRS